MGGGRDGISHATDRNGNPNVFNLDADDDQLVLDGNDWVSPGNRWHPDSRFVFLFRKSES